jgi:hypothetical protein
MGIFYLIGSFNALTFNPTHWTDVGRALFSFIGTLIAVVVTIIINDNGQEEEK